MIELDLIKKQVAEALTEPEIDENGDVEELPTPQTLEIFYNLLENLYKSLNVDSGVFWYAGMWYGSVFAYWQSKDRLKLVKLSIRDDKGYIYYQLDRGKQATYDRVLDLSTLSDWVMWVANENAPFPKNIHIFKAKDGTTLKVTNQTGKPCQGGQHVNMAYNWYYKNDDWHIFDSRQSLYKIKKLVENANTVEDIFNASA